MIERFGRVPRRLIWDGETGIGRRGRLAAGVAEFSGTLATRVHQLKPRDPESKGVVERRNGFFETSFMPGRSFDSPGDFNAQFADWLERANRRVVRTLKARPIDLVDADREAMLGLPPIAPMVGWSNQIRLGRDYYVRVDSNDYSVDPTAIGRTVTTHAYAKSMVGCSSARISLLPPRARCTARLPSISARSSAGSSEIGTSGPGQVLSETKCFSRTLAPSATAAIDVWMPSE